MKLSETAIAAKTQLHGHGVYTVTAGQEFKIELPQLDVLDETVPAGKIWSISINIAIDETDA